MMRSRPVCKKSDNAMAKVSDTLRVAVDSFVHFLSDWQPTVIPLQLLKIVLATNDLNDLYYCTHRLIFSSWEWDFLLSFGLVPSFIQQSMVHWENKAHIKGTKPTIMISVIMLHSCLWLKYSIHFHHYTKYKHIFELKCFPEITDATICRLMMYITLGSVCIHPSYIT